MWNSVVEDCYWYTGNKLGIENDWVIEFAHQVIGDSSRVTHDEIFWLACYRICSLCTHWGLFCSEPLVMVDTELVQTVVKITDAITDGWQSENWLALSAPVWIRRDIVMCAEWIGDQGKLWTG